MKKRYKVLISLLLIGIVFIFGCAAEGSSPPPPSGPIGGGCGVTAPADSADSTVINEISETAEKKPSL